MVHMAKRSRPNEPTPVPRLNVPRDDARNAIVGHKAKGEEIRDIPIDTKQSLDEARAKRKAWKAFGTLMLKKQFSTDELATKFDYSSKGHYQMNAPPQVRIDDFRQDMQASIDELQSIVEQLPLIDELTPAPTKIPMASRAATKSVFVVHGHDDAAKLEVARFLEQLDLQPIILHEQPNKGRTIIEKLEGHSNVGYAVVILSPDDFGGKASDPDTASPRARQNVILELGFFCGVLGRANILALRKGDLEIPSDFDGVIYENLDVGGGWKMRLALELKEAGLPIDLNRVPSPPRVEKS